MFRTLIGASLVLNLVLAVAGSVSANTSVTLPVAGSQESLLPEWFVASPTTGVREVWLVPLYAQEEKAWDSSALLKDANTKLEWFTRESRGALSMTATRVLPAPRFSLLDASSACNAMARVWASTLSDMRATGVSENVHLVGLSRVRDCPYLGLAETPGNWVLVTGLPQEVDVRGHTLIHELGHNLGLPHAAGYAAGQLSFTTGASPVSFRRGSTDWEEYGDKTDIMGRGGFNAGLNPMSRAALGWGDGVFSLPTAIAGTFEVTLSSIALPGPDALVWTDPVDGARYAVSFTSRESKEAGFLPRRSGVFLHSVRYADPPGVRGRTPFGVLMPWDEHSLGLGGNAGTHWVSPTRTTSIHILETSKKQARIMVKMDPSGALTDDWGPAWPMPPTVERQPDRTEAFLRLPAAWDQSGVVRYRVIADGGKVISSYSPRSLTEPGLAVIGLSKPKTRLQVVATDGAGNTSTWTKIVYRTKRNLR